jgi:transposase
MYSQDVRVIAFKLYRKINSLRKVSRIIDTSHSTVSRWMNFFSKAPRKISQKKLDKPEILNAIELFIKTHPFAIVKDVQKLIVKEFNISPSYELCRLLLKKLNFSRKRARYFSVSKNAEQKLNEFLTKREQFVNQNRLFVSIDETSFGRNYLPASGYSKRGKRLNIKRPFCSVKTSSVVSAVCIGQKLQFFKKFGSFNTDSFLDFLCGLDYPENTVILMDNVSFHHSKKVIEFLEFRNWDVLFTPPYSPIFNPIEGVFSIVKRYYQKFLHIENAFKSVTDNHIRGFFRGSFKATNQLE